MHFLPLPRHYLRHRLLTEEHRLQLGLKELHHPR